MTTVPSSNVEALALTLDELRRLGRLEPVDAARIQALRSMAAVLDEDPSSAPLWRQYRDALREVLTAGDDADDGLAAALAEIRGSAEMGDPSSS